MAIKIPYLHDEKAAGGVTAYYWKPGAALRKAGWKGKALGTDLGEAVKEAQALNEQVKSWRLGGARPKTVKTFHQRATFGALVDAYKVAFFKPKAEGGHAKSTQKEYGSKFTTLLHWTTLDGREGGMSLAAIDARSVKILRDALMSPDAEGNVRHTMAHATLRVLRTLLEFAEKQELIPKGSNPAKDFDLDAPPPRQQIWSDGAFPAFAAAAEQLGLASVGFAAELGREIGQREGDIIRMGRRQWVEVKPYRMQPDVYRQLAAERGDVWGFRIKQRKTNTIVEVPVVGETRRKVEGWIRRGTAAGVTTILFDEDSGTPWDETRFQRAVLEVRQAAIADAMPRLVEAAEHAQQPSIALAAELAELTRLPWYRVLGMRLDQWVEIRVAAKSPAGTRVDRRGRLASIVAGADGKAEVGPRQGQQLAGADGKVMGIRLGAKGAPGARVIPIAGETRIRLEAAIAHARMAKSDRILLEARTGEPWELDEFNDVLEDMKVAGNCWGVEFIHKEFRDLRRTAVVWLGTLGIDIHLIAAITGHSIQQTTDILKVYLPATTGQAALAVALRVERAGAGEIGHNSQAVGATKE